MLYAVRTLPDATALSNCCSGYFLDMVAKSIGDDTNNKQLLILPFDN